MNKNFTCRKGTYMFIEIQGQEVTGIENAQEQQVNVAFSEDVQRV